MNWQLNFWGKMHYAPAHADKLWIKSSFDKIIKDMGTLSAVHSKIFCQHQRNKCEMMCSCMHEIFQGQSTKGQNWLKVLAFLWKYKPPADPDYICCPPSMFLSTSLNAFINPSSYPPAPLSPFLSILPICLSVGSLHEKVVHFWISCLFEVSPNSFSHVWNQPFLSSIFPLICSPPVFYPYLVPLLFCPPPRTHIHVYFIPQPVCGSCFLWLISFRCFFIFSFVSSSVLIQ